MPKEHYSLQLSRHYVLVDTRVQVPGFPHRRLRKQRSGSIHRSRCGIRPDHEAGQLEDLDLTKDQETYRGRAVDAVICGRCNDRTIYLVHLLPLGYDTGRDQYYDVLSSRTDRELKSLVTTIRTN